MSKYRNIQEKCQSWDWSKPHLSHRFMFATLQYLNFIRSLTHLCDCSMSHIILFYIVFWFVSYRCIWCCLLLTRITEARITTHPLPHQMFRKCFLIITQYTTPLVLHQQQWGRQPHQNQKQIIDVSQWQLSFRVLCPLHPCWKLEGLLNQLPKQASINLWAIWHCIQKVDRCTRDRV